MSADSTLSVKRFGLCLKDTDCIFRVTSRESVSISSVP